MSDPTQNKSEEASKLQYKSNKLPIAIIIPWAILLVFCVVYLATYAWPELMSHFRR
jgi:hypothetical protein